MVEYYERLNVKRDASQEEIKQAFKTLAKKYHPDVNQGDEQSETKFKEISEAYDTLKNPEERAVYDASGVRAKQAEQRVQRAKKIEAQKTKNNGLFVKANVNHQKYKTTLAYKLTQALN